MSTGRRRGGEGGIIFNFGFLIIGEGEGGNVVLKLEA